IDYTEFMRRDISTWPKPLHMSKISELLSKYNLRDGAEEVVESIHSRGIGTAIISAGINLLGYSIAKRLGIQHVYINELCIDENGFLTGQGIMKVDLMSKHLVLVELSESLGLSLSECIAVDDSIYNIKFLQTAGLGLYLCDGDISIKSGITTIKSLREILNYI
ncbi:MAG: HAD-IB family phosphatase, partial [Candidatus Methylarchaceae archaeon HK02M2]|nr:HAD-IB family phosphatase [Candidatus Methylarchaceae archaeon HK02M2]